MVSKKYVIVFFNLYLNDFVNEISCFAFSGKIEGITPAI